MKKKGLPKGVQEFREIRELGYYYVDKTGYIDLLMQEENKTVFLSRPRRFGKSLFVDTLREAFMGSEELFRGLDLHDKWDWSTPHPVIRLDFCAGHFLSPDGLRKIAVDLLKACEEEAGLDSSEPDPVVRLRQLIRSLHNQTGQKVVLLVDEYDKPILDTLENQDLAVANRNLLSNIFAVTKQMASSLRFCFITGVSRFTKTSLFSGVNNLEDITISPEYSSICGYTEADLDRIFAPEAEGLDREKIREWYNGYSWLGDEKVYNPYDILYLLAKRKYLPWWFRTGTPKFLIETLKKNEVMSVDLSHPLAHSELLESFDIDNIDPKTLLFQTGYLTIVDEELDEDDETSYRLDYPNREVRQFLNRQLLEMQSPSTSTKLQNERGQLTKYMSACDVERLKTHFQAILAGLPKQWHAPVNLAQYEAYFASVFYSYFTGAGLKVQAEVATNEGRIDMVVSGSSYVYIFEFKMVEGKGSGEAIQQILDKDYARQFLGKGNPIYLAGVEVSKKNKQHCWIQSD